MRYQMIGNGNTAPTEINDHLHQEILVTRTHITFWLDEVIRVPTTISMISLSAIQEEVLTELAPTSRAIKWRWVSGEVPNTMQLHSAISETGFRVFVQRLNQMIQTVQFKPSSGGKLDHVPASRHVSSIVKRSSRSQMGIVGKFDSLIC